MALHLSVLTGFDTSVGNGFVGLDQMSDAAAHATIVLVQSSAMLNGERAKGNFNTDEKIIEQAD